MSAVSYSMALRCIGQDLERRGLKTFDIQRDGSNLSVIYRPGAAKAAVTLQYTPADIEILDRCGETYRGKTATNEFLNAIQTLRVIGDYLDKYASTLIRITNSEAAVHAPLFKVEYVTREGDHVVDDGPGSAIFDMCILMVQKRRRMAEDHGRSAGGSR